MEARPLPQRPSLDQYKKQAKDLLKACKSADATAIRVWAEERAAESESRAFSGRQRSAAEDGRFQSNLHGGASKARI